MNEYFAPKNPEPRMGVFDIVLRALICVIAVLILGVGIWMTIDSLQGKAVTKTATKQDGSAASNAMAHLPDQSR